jgi:hypothetical protein
VRVGEFELLVVCELEEVKGADDPLELKLELVVVDEELELVLLETVCPNTLASLRMMLLLAPRLLARQEFEVPCWIVSAESEHSCVRRLQNLIGKLVGGGRIVQELMGLRDLRIERKVYEPVAVDPRACKGFGGTGKSRLCNRFLNPWGEETRKGFKSSQMLLGVEK